MSRLFAIRNDSELSDRASDRPLFDSEPFSVDWSEYPEPGYQDNLEADPKNNTDDSNVNTKFLPGGS